MASENGTPVHLRQQDGTIYNGSTAAAQGNWGTLAHGQQSVTTSGTSESLAAQAIPNGAALTIRADGDNAGNIYVGDSSVSSSNGFVLGAGESVSVQLSDVSDAHIDADNDGEGVSWIVEVA